MLKRHLTAFIMTSIEFNWITVGRNSQRLLVHLEVVCSLISIAKSEQLQCTFHPWQLDKYMCKKYMYHIELRVCSFTNFMYIT